MNTSEPGRAIATGGGTLAAPYVIHAVAVGHDRVADAGRLRAAVHAALALCPPLQLHRIAIAPLGTEHGSFALDEAADVLVGTLVEDAPTAGLRSVVIATAHPAETHAVVEALARHRARVG